MFGLKAGARWSGATKRLITSKRFSNRPLELLTTEAAKVLPGKYGSIPKERRIDLRCDNTSAWSVCNGEDAFIPAIGFALKILVC